jgi:hypothetical protein
MLYKLGVRSIQLGFPVEILASQRTAQAVISSKTTIMEEMSTLSNPSAHLCTDQRRYYTECLKGGTTNLQVKFPSFQCVQDQYQAL